MPGETMRVGYVLKRYPRYSETFIVNEILAHEAAGLEIEIFALRPINDTHFQDAIARVKAPVNYIPAAVPKSSDFWAELSGAGRATPDIWTALRTAQDEAVLDIYQAALLAREVRLRGICHLHAHFASVATSVTRLAARFAGIPYTFTAHAKDIFHENVNPENMQRKLNDASAVITVSDYNLKYLHAIYGPSAQHVQRVYNGLDIDRFPYKAPDRRKMRIISVGRLVEKKGFNDLIEACAILADRGCAFGCHIIGTGPLEAELSAQIERLGLQSYIELAGLLPRDELIEAVQDAAVFAAPCIIGRDADRDGLPTVLLEAMALGTPCVSTDVTGIPEVLYDGKTGLMVSQHNPAELAAALERLLSDPALRVQLAAKARQLIEAKFDININSAFIRDIFQSTRQIRIAQKVD
ncbi:glycosyltransferase [Candidatus Methanoperedens nitroreducens]|uniref:Glycosyltransferase n=1 Tax=Candidatus Methanoperedens nitratireducens TaxID=1392998 RepID=A0A062VCL2_9EURY|nr:glycosyltransferase family 4 protein [Candidatus Methanoperedens nitroreducens]KCZ73404.1 glycosyltransferase [Candidatus Methanoperedens nitroreducens]MDJ1422641.1 glycosyltransferase family 4 protein [Candidatus Methanoperedens sp.]